jgi:acetyl esterase/lipase
MKRDVTRTQGSAPHTRSAPHRRSAPLLALALALLCAASSGARAQGAGSQFDQVVRLSHAYQAELNVTYRTISNWDAKLDILRPRNASRPTPTLLFFHGGGWTRGSKEQGLMGALPYMEMGYAVVNVAYRLSSVALAPAAVEDARCALRWVYSNAKQYNFDTTRIVLSGASAGGNLALLGAMLPADAGFDLGCPGDRGLGPPNMEPLKVAAVINWYGVVDVREVMAGPNRRAFAEMWLGMQPDRERIATQVSPLTYVRPGMPPVLTIHGDADGTVPYTQAVRLHEALEKAGVPNQLITVPKGDHGNFALDDTLRIYAAIRGFLSRHLAAAASH